MHFCTKDSIISGHFYYEWKMTIDLTRPHEENSHSFFIFPTLTVSLTLTLSPSHTQVASTQYGLSRQVNSEDLQVVLLAASRPGQLTSSPPSRQSEDRQQFRLVVREQSPIYFPHNCEVNMEKRLRHWDTVLAPPAKLTSIRQGINYGGRTE